MHLFLLRAGMRTESFVRWRSEVGSGLGRRGQAVSESSSQPFASGGRRMSSRISRVPRRGSPAPDLAAGDVEDDQGGRRGGARVVDR
jgi:hypothetical protein